ncbi:OmpA family protein [Undibacterium crateris]|uniref:OmpA family protein n=1 Tax=Undibacterium crateris TaxID=2528175 RepID=UPI00138A21FF|nr:OmpA family protein [Undibacterium crateris]NDI84216.1 OmpA family protein [Undibacterium crateris]
MTTHNRTQSTISIVLASTSLLILTSAYADDPYPSWYILPSLHIADIDEGFGSGTSAYGLGLRFGKPVSENVDMQIGTSFTRSKNSAQRFYQNAYSLDALYLFSRNSLRPFVVAGAGVERNRMNSLLGQADRYSPNVNLGVGVQFSMSDQWSIQADLRKVHSYLRGQEYGFSQASHSFLSIALSYAFDKPVRAAPQVRAAEPVRMPAEPIPIAVRTPDPAPAPAPAPARFEKITLSATELFAFDNATLHGKQIKLDTLADALNANTQIQNIIITGYADRIGAKRYNQTLSEQRANTVKAYLVEKGIAPNRMTASGKGESNPVVECHDKIRSQLIKCLEPNRRVEVDQITIEQRVP